MLNRVRLWVRGYQNVYRSNHFRSNRCWYWYAYHLSRGFALSFFSICPIVSFYPKSLHAIGRLNLLPEIEHTLSGKLNVGTLKKDDSSFKSLAKVIGKTYKFEEAFDEIKLKKTEKFFTGWDSKKDIPIYSGGEYYLELLKTPQTLRKILINEQFSEVKRELDRTARKYLAIAFVIVGLVAILIGVLKW